MCWILQNNDMNKGFTLIELLIVVAIIGILAAVGTAVIPGLLGGAKEKASRANHKQVVHFIQNMTKNPKIVFDIFKN